MASCGPPSLSSTDGHQPAGRRTSAFLLQALSQSRIMICLGNHGFPCMEGAITSRRRGDGQIADAYIHTCHKAQGLRCRGCYLDLKRDEQVEALPGFVIPQLGSTDFSTLLDKHNMRAVARVGHDHPPRERQDADVLLALETVVFAVLVGQGRRDILGRLVQALVAFLGQPRLSVCSVLLDFGPQRFVGSTHLTRNGARHLGRQMKTGTHLIVGAILQSHSIAHLAVLKSIVADIVQGIAIRQLRVAQGLELCRGSQQFELSGNDRFHMFYCINISTACQEEEASEELSPVMPFLPPAP